MKDKFGFIIPSYCDSELHFLQLDRCLSSIRKFHDEKIIVIDDFSKIDLKEKLKGYKNVIIVESSVKAAGDMVTYTVFKNNPLFQKAVIFQDSMVLEKELTNINDIKNIKYIWYFTNHRLHWSKIKEPQTEYNIKHGIKVHDDAVLDIIKNLTVDEFKSYALNIYRDKDKWCGCFGCLSVVDYNFIDELNTKTGIIDLLMKMNDNRLRRVSESIFSLACQFVLGDEVFENGYDGLYYDGIRSPRNRIKFNGSKIGFPDNVIIDQVCKNDFFSKVSFDRRPIKII